MLTKEKSEDHRYFLQFSWELEKIPVTSTDMSSCHCELCLAEENQNHSACSSRRVVARVLFSRAQAGVFVVAFYRVLNVTFTESVKSLPSISNRLSKVCPPQKPLSVECYHCVDIQSDRIDDDSL